MQSNHHKGWAGDELGWAEGKPSLSVPWSSGHAADNHGPGGHQLGHCDESGVPVSAFPVYAIPWHRRCCKSYQWWFPTSWRMEICKISLASNGSFPRTVSLGGASYWQLEGPEELLTVFRPQARRLDLIQHKWNCFIYFNGLMAREECSLACDSHSLVPDMRSSAQPCSRKHCSQGQDIYPYVSPGGKVSAGSCCLIRDAYSSLRPVGWTCISSLVRWAHEAAPHDEGGLFEPPVSNNGQEEIPEEKHKRGNHAMTPPRVHFQPPGIGGIGHQAYKESEALLTKNRQQQKPVNNYSSSTSRAPWYNEAQLRVTCGPVLRSERKMSKFIQNRESLLSPQNRLTPNCK